MKYFLKHKNHATTFKKAKFYIAFEWFVLLTFESKIYNLKKVKKHEISVNFSIILNLHSFQNNDKWNYINNYKQGMDIF